MFSFRVVVICLAVSLLMPALGGAACSADMAASMSLASTGPYRGLKRELCRGYRTCIEAGGRNELPGGRRLMIKALDNGRHPGPAATNTPTFANKDRIFWLFNHDGTQAVPRVLPSLKMYGPKAWLRVLFSKADQQRSSACCGTVLNLRARNRQATWGLVDNLVRADRKRIGLVFQADASGWSRWDGAPPVLPAHCLSNTGEPDCRWGDSFTQISGEQAAIIPAKQPDADIWVEAGTTCAGFTADFCVYGWDAPVTGLCFGDSGHRLVGISLPPGRAKAQNAKNHMNSPKVPSLEDGYLHEGREYKKTMARYETSPPQQFASAGILAGLEGFLNSELFINNPISVAIPYYQGGLVQTLAGWGDYGLGHGNAGPCWTSGRPGALQRLFHDG